MFINGSSTELHSPHGNQPTYRTTPFRYIEILYIFIIAQHAVKRNYAAI